MDAIARLTPACISSQGYVALLTSLQVSLRRNVHFFDHGCHIEMRSRLRQHLCIGLQRQLLENGAASEMLVEDLLG